MTTHSSKVHTSLSQDSNENYLSLNSSATWTEKDLTPLRVECR